MFTEDWKDEYNTWMGFGGYNFFARITEVLRLGNVKTSFVALGAIIGSGTIGGAIGGFLKRLMWTKL